MNAFSEEILNFIEDLNKRINQNLVITLHALQGNFQLLEDLLQVQKAVQNIRGCTSYKISKEIPVKDEKKLLQPKISALSFAASEECMKLENLENVKSIISNDDANILFMSKNDVSNLTLNQTKSNIFDEERKGFSTTNRKFKTYDITPIEMVNAEDICKDQKMITNGNKCTSVSSTKNTINIKEKSFFDESDSYYSEKIFCSMEDNLNPTQRRDYYNSSAFTDNNNHIKKASKNRITDLKPQTINKNSINQKIILKPKKLSQTTNLDINRIQESVLKSQLNLIKLKNIRPQSNGKNAKTYRKFILNKEQPRKRNNWKKNSSGVENTVNKTKYKLISKSM